MRGITYMNRKDISGYPITGEINQGRFKKERRDIDGRDAFIKYNYINNKTSRNFLFNDIHELIAQDVYSLLGLKCAEYELGVCNDEACIISYNFLKEKETLITGDTLLSDTLVSKWENKIFSGEMNYGAGGIETVLESINFFESSQRENLRKAFLEKTVVDYLLANFDGKPENLGIIYNSDNKEYYPAPSFDNSFIFDQQENGLQFAGNQLCEGEEGIDYIAANYYGYVEELIGSIEGRLTPENLKVQLHKYDKPSEQSLENQPEIQPEQDEIVFDSEAAYSLITERRDRILERFKNRSINKSQTCGKKCSTAQLNKEADGFLGR